MSTNFSIGGLIITPQFCKKINPESDLLTFFEISQQPLVNIYNNGNDTFTVNIVSFIPNDIEEIDENELNNSSFFIDGDRKIAFSYNGVSGIRTGISTINPNNVVLTRKFQIIYKSGSLNFFNGSTAHIISTDKKNEANEIERNPKFNAYHIKIVYGFISCNFQSAEGIIVKDHNIDPETPRGTVSSSTRPER